MTTVLAFLVTLGILIVVHEYGHYKVARLCGVKVLRFSVGFGKVIWRRQRSANDTEFVVAALPLGGYVRMLDEREGPVASHEQSQAFNRQSLWKRTAIVAAGPVANLLLAILLYAGAHWIGMREPAAVLAAPMPNSAAERADLRAGDRVEALSVDGVTWVPVASMADFQWEVTQAALAARPLHLRVTAEGRQGTRQLRLGLDELRLKDLDAASIQRIGLAGAWRPPILGEVRKGGAAEAAGLLRGDRVLRIDGEPVSDATTAHRRIRASADRAMRWSVERDGRTLDLDVRPRAAQDPSDGSTVGRIEAALGAAPAMVTVRHGPIDGWLKGMQRTWDVSVLTLRMLGRMLIGEASIKNLTGPLTIADVAGQSANLGLAYFLSFLALVSVGLGIMNLLPLPMLDGGHLMYYLFEALSGRPVSDAWAERLQRGGVFVLVLLMFIALSNDVTRLLGR